LSSPIEGQIRQLLHQISETLLDGADLDIEAVGNLLLLTKDVNVPRYFPLYYISEAGDTTLIITAPKGKVWEIYDARFILTTDANVADRNFEVYKEFFDKSGTARSIKGWLDATVAASTSYRVDLHAASSADAKDDVDSCMNQDSIIIAGPDFKGKNGERLLLKIAANGQAGDLMKAQLSIKETVNFMM
jgi:hypothetical protein